MKSLEGLDIIFECENSTGCHPFPDRGPFERVLGQPRRELGVPHPGLRPGRRPHLLRRAGKEGKLQGCQMAIANFLNCMC